jgi:protein-tyrosine phosphatase
MIRVLFVCMGNICRSPTAEGVLREKLRAAGLERLVEVDSAGTHGYHKGDPPDPRAQRHARQRGYDLSRLRARRVNEADFARFDLILAMDDDNLAELESLRPADARAELGLLMAHGDGARGRVVPDPYYGDAAGFERVLDDVEHACDGLLAHLRARLEGGGGGGGTS